MKRLTNNLLQDGFKSQCAKMTEIDSCNVVQLTKEELNSVGIHCFTNSIKRHRYVREIYKESIIGILPFLIGKTYPEIKTILRNLDDLTRSILNSSPLG